MASESDHLSCANRTHQTIKHLLADNVTNSPWVAIAAFYKALHIVEAVFSNDARIRNTSNHDERDSALKKNRKYSHLYKHYGPLKRASLNARYLAEDSCFDKYMPPERVISELLLHHLHQIESTAAGFLSENARVLSAKEFGNAGKSPSPPVSS